MKLQLSERTLLDDAEASYLPREAFVNTKMDTQRQNLIQQLLSTQQDSEQLDSDELAELQERLNSIRSKHQQQRLGLFDQYTTLKAKARDIAAEAAQCSSAASTARQSAQCDRLR